jgi:uncharacterized protein (TIGR03437 family)
MKSLLYVFVAVGAIAFGQSDTAITLVPTAFVPLGLRNTGGRSIATDDSGNFYVAGAAQGGGQVAKIDPNGKVLYSKSVAGSLLGVAVDKTGSSYIVGAASTGTIFCTKLSPDGSSIVFSTLLGMGEADAVAVDASGNAYVTGRVISGMASTPGAFQTVLHGPDAFVTKLGPDGKVVFTTFLGGNGPACNPGGSCSVGLFGGGSITDDEEGFAIAVDQAGNVYVAGVTNAADFPVTPNAFQTKYSDPSGIADQGFISKLTPDGSALLYSTYLGTTTFNVRIGTLVVNSSGEAIVAGHTDSSAFPTTQGALFPSPHVPGGFIARLNSQGSALLYATYLGNGVVNGIAIDDAGNLNVTGWDSYVTPSGTFPVTNGALPIGFTYLTQLSADGRSLIYSTLLPYGSAGNSVALSMSRTPAVIGDAGVLTIFGSGDPAQPTVFSLANIAGPYVDGQVAPGEIVSLYGTNLGPDKAVGLALDPSGFIATQLAGVQVKFDGVPAPIIMSQRNQVNIQVPYEIAGRGVTVMQVISTAGTSQMFPLQAVPLEPDILTVDSVYAAAINQDGSINTDVNPAPQGSVISLFAIGTGLWNGDLKTGQVSSTSLLAPILPVKVFIGSSSGPEAEVLYAGSAPTLTDGVLQLNILLPISKEFNLTTGFVLQVGDIQGPTATVWTRFPGTSGTDPLSAVRDAARRR